MTLLDRLRASPPERHPDPAVRLAHVAGIPLDDHQAIAAIARGDEDPGVRRAAVAKLMDPAVLGPVARDDADESVRAAAVGMLRDIALDVFEGVGESDSLDAVDAISDPKTLVHVARHATLDLVALRALARVADAHALGSVARHGVAEAARLGALDMLGQRGEQAEIVAVAMNGEHRDAALAAVDLVAGDRAAVDVIAARGRNKAAAKRARSLLREAGDRGAAEAVAAQEAEAAGTTDSPPEIRATDAGEEQATTMESAEAVRPVDEEAAQEPFVPAVEEAADAERAAAAEAEAARAAFEERQARLSALADAAVAAAGSPDLESAEKTLAVIRREWRQTAVAIDGETDAGLRFGRAEAEVAARSAAVREADARVRREGLGRLRHLLGRVEALLENPDVTLKAVERGLRDLRAALSAVPPLPDGPEGDEVVRRLKAAQTALALRVREMREATEWQQWANSSVQEQLCARMEALAAVEDPAAVVTEVRALQQQWRDVADAPRAQADQLWKRFKAAHDVVWPRVQAHFAAEVEARNANLARKTALCERAEALAGSTNWIQTADEIKTLQAEWKTIGPVSRGREKAVWERFRTACDQFFTRRQADLVERKKAWAENYAKKEALAVRAEALAESTDWDGAAAEIRRLQAEWKTIGPVRKSRSEAIWQRFRGACDQFFSRHARRHDSARAERAAAREAICAELEALAATPEGIEALPDLRATVRGIRSRWQHEVASRAIEPERAQALDARFSTALAAALARWPGEFAGTELDPDANRKRMESLVLRVERLAQSIDTQSGGTAGDDHLTPAERLAARLKEALAANTIGGRVAEDSRWRAAAEEVRQARTAWSGLGAVPEDVRRTLGDRFHRACRRITERAAAAGATRS
jgi:hypothetical protein